MAIPTLAFDPARDAALLETIMQAADERTVVQTVRAFHEADGKTIKDFFLSGGRADQAMHASSDRMDLVLRTLFEYAHRRHYGRGNRTTGENLTVIAVGGYGRGELAPHSDVDLLFLHPYKRTPYVEQMCEFVLYKLWDLGLKVGQSTRTVGECIKLAQDDITIKTTLLETRLLWGTAELFEELQARFAKEVKSGQGSAFIEAKLAERDARHKKTGDSRFLLEPNIKEGKGGLRDLHTLMWLCRFLYDFETLDDLIELNVLSANEVRRYRRSTQFLWTVRCHLHYLTNRAEERLTFDLQTKVADKLGYRDNGQTQKIERFMRHYYLVARDVGALTRIVCAVLEDQFQRRPRFSLSALGLGTRRVSGFTIQGGRISVPNAQTFIDAPIKALQIFQIAQERKLDIHPKAMAALQRSLHKIARTLEQDPAANRLFLDILTAKNDPAQTLSRMNEVGLIGGFIPAFRRIVAQMQHNLYHSYTVDEHTIRAIQILGQIERGEIKHEVPLASDLIRKILGRRELYVAMFFHDIGKGQEREHSEVGAEIAAEMCPRLGLNEDETSTVVWLVRYHLYMSGYAFKRDPEDPKTIADFASIVDSLERLRLLLILTVADIRAVGPNIWNGWKGQLLRGLYNETAAAISSGDPTGAASARITAAQEALSAQLAPLPDWTSDIIADYIMRHDQRYWLSFSGGEHVDHALAIKAADLDEAPLTIRYKVDEFRARTELFLFAADHPGLFKKLAGAIALSGLSIVDARILTTLDGMALDVIGFQNAETRDAVADEGRLDRLTSNIKKALGGAIWLDQELLNKRPPARANQHFDVEPRIRIDNDASRTHSVLEINGKDRPGLLYDVCKTLLELGLVLNSAHISTYGERVVDVFYVKDVFGMKITQANKQRRIEKRLGDAISHSTLERV